MSSIGMLRIAVLTGVIAFVADCGDGSTVSTVRHLSLVPLHISSGCNGDVRLREAVNKVLTDQSAFDDELAGSIQMPPASIVIDFTQSVVVVAHAGLRTNCGSSVAISDARETESTIEVEVTISSGLNCPANDSISYPVAFAEIPKSTKPYVFVEKRNDACVAAAGS